MLFFFICFCGSFGLLLVVVEMGLVSGRGDNPSVELAAVAAITTATVVRLLGEGAVPITFLSELLDLDHCVAAVSCSVVFVGVGRLRLTVVV